MTINEAIETLKYEIEEECHCDYIAEEIRCLISAYENLIAQEEKAHQYCKNVCEPKYKAEIEKLNQINFDLCNAGGKLLHKAETIKAEAYKECIEKVKNELKNIAKIEWQDNYYYLVGTAFFDNLLKELVGCE